MPGGIRLDIALIKRRGGFDEAERLLPSLKTIAKVRSGSKISRYFRHIFEHKHIKRILGSQIALFVIASSFLPTSASNFDNADEYIVSAPTVQIKTEEHIQHPLQKIKINQGYSFFHAGIDFEGKTGDPIRPIMVGEVVGIQFSNLAYGNAVLVRHGDNFSSLYAHMSKIDVKEGDKVDLNTVLGKVGSSGRSSGDHLHLEIRENGRPINPFSMLPKINLAPR